MVNDYFDQPVTEERWKQVELEIQLFARTYPLHWNIFRRDLREQQTKYQLALEGDLKKSSFRNTASFPIVYRKKTLQEMMNDPLADDDVEEVANLYTTLKYILPGLTDADKKGAPNKLYREFLRRFPLFRPGENN